ncbi:MAG: NUDIX domain-containing protein [Deltaproteobacteria bacterium]|nr:NUDIX domain-containing protein [Deltaproteobacteria bacterium]
MNREYPEYPLVGVAAVIFEGESVWLARRGREPARGRLSLPGGLVELGESHLEALARELWEELRIRIAVGGLAGVFDKIFRDPKGRIRYHYVVVDYWGWITEGQPTPGSDITEVIQVPLRALDDLEADRDLIKAISIAEKAMRKRMVSRGDAPVKQKPERFHGVNRGTQRKDI